MPYLFPEGAQFGVDHLVLHASSRRHRVDGFAGPCSIKTVVQGVVAWTVGGRELVVDTGSFLVLGSGEAYSMNIDAPRAVETACVFFRDGFVESIARDATGFEGIDDPERPTPPLPWISRLHADDAQRFVPPVQNLAKRCSANLMPSGLEENLLLLARDLLFLYDEIRSRMQNIRAEKASTREELFRRVEAGREYMHSWAEARLSLEDVARAACLSRYHFHRAFAMVWQRTPHEYLTAIRLERAKEALASGLPVAEACAAAGFASLSSFSRLFRATYGLPPGQIRKLRHSTGYRQTVSSGS